MPLTKPSKTLLILIFFITSYIIIQNHISTLLSSLVKVSDRYLPENSSITSALLDLTKLYTTDQAQLARYISTFKEMKHLQKEVNKYQNQKVQRVASLIEFKQAIKRAVAGDIISVAAGVYRLDNSIDIAANGTLKKAVVIQAEELHQALFLIHSDIGLKFQAKHLELRGFTFEGKCQPNERCHHAIQILGDSKHLKINQNKFINFNAHIKSNGFYNDKAEQWQYPNNIIIKQNELFNHSIRTTNAPVTPIDIVGGEKFQIHSNLIYDFAKTKGNKISYGLFAKGGGRHAKITNNMIICEYKLRTKVIPDYRVAISLGGGGTSPESCPLNNCAYEHSNGRIEGNIIYNCSLSSGIFLNKVKQSKVIGNCIFNSLDVLELNNNLYNVIEKNTLSQSSTFKMFNDCL